MTVVDRIAELIKPTLEDLGFELVRVKMQGGARRVLQIMAEPFDRTHQMTVDDCATISRSVSAILDVADPIADAYQLEVSSPGLDRPLTKLEDFERFSGFEGRVEIEPALDGRKKWRGTIAGIDGDDILLHSDGESVRLSFDNVTKAKLVLTDALIAASIGRTAAS